MRALATELEGHARNQTAHDVAARGATRTKSALMRNLIEDHMRPIARLAAADAPVIPALAAFRLPNGSVPDEVVLDRARGMGEVAANDAGRFIADRLPATFVTDLNAAVDNIRTTFDVQTSNRGNRVQATTALASRTCVAKRVVRILDALVRKQVKDDGFLANWESAKKVVINAGRPAASAAAPAATSQNLPGPSQNLPGTSQHLPGTSTSPTGTSKRLPGTSKRLPGTSKRLPSVSTPLSGTSTSPSDAPTSAPAPSAAAA